MVFLNNISWEGRKSQSKHRLAKGKERNQWRRKVVYVQGAGVAGGWPWHRGTLCDLPSDLMGRQTQKWMKVPFKWLFSSWNQKGLLRAQVNEPWCNRRQAATSETKHKPRFLPEYSTKGMGCHCTHFQVAVYWFLMFLYLCQMFRPLCVPFSTLSQSALCLSLFCISVFSSPA